MCVNLIKTKGRSVGFQCNAQIRHLKRCDSSTVEIKLKCVVIGVVNRFFINSIYEKKFYFPQEIVINWG